MTADFLRTSVPDLAAVPVALRDYYDQHPDGSFRLRVRGALPTQQPAPAPAQPPEPKREQRSRYEPTGTAGDRLREAAVADAVARIRPRPEHAEDVAQFLRDRLRIDNQDGEPVLAYLEEAGEGGQRMLSRVQHGHWVASADEWLSRVASALDEKWLVTEPQPEPAIVVDLPPTPDRVRLRPGYTQREFERAHQLAAQHGASVEFPHETAPPQPSYHGGKNVPWRAGGSQESFEAAMRTANAMGGSIDFIAQED